MQYITIIVQCNFIKIYKHVDSDGGKNRSCLQNETEVHFQRHLAAIADLNLGWKLLAGPSQGDSGHLGPMFIEFTLERIDTLAGLFTVTSSQQRSTHDSPMDSGLGCLMTALERLTAAVR